MIRCPIVQLMVVVAAIVGSNLSRSFAAPPKFWSLETPDGWQSEGSFISANGQIVVGRIYHDEDGKSRPAEWDLSTGEFRVLPGADSIDSQIVSALSPDGGWYTVETSDLGRYETRLWSRDGNNLVLQAEEPYRAAVNAALNQGQGAVGTYASAFETSRAVIWGSDGVPTYLPSDTPFYPSIATAATADGGFIGGSINAEACLWDAERDLTYLGTLPGDMYSVVRAISANGQFVFGDSGNYVSVGTARTAAFRWTVEDGMKSLGRFEGFERTMISDVTADGRIITGVATKQGMRAIPLIHGIGHSWRDLQAYLSSPEIGLAEELEGWKLIHAKVSDDGRTFSGTAFDADWQVRAWAATIPEPSTLPLTMAGSVVALVALRLRRKQLAS